MLKKDILSLERCSSLESLQAVGTASHWVLLPSPPQVSFTVLHKVGGEKNESWCRKAQGFSKGRLSEISIHTQSSFEMSLLSWLDLVNEDFSARQHQNRGARLEATHYPVLLLDWEGNEKGLPENLIYWISSSSAGVAVVVVCSCQPHHRLHSLYCSGCSYLKLLVVFTKAGVGSCGL